MADEWKTGSLGDIAEVVMGHSPAGETCNSTGIGDPLLNGPTEFGPHYPSPVQFTTEPKRHSCEGDILFCVRGSTTGRMNWSDQRYAIGRGLAAIRHKSSRDYRHFLKAVIDLNLPDLLAAATGSTFPCVSRDQILGMPVELPPLLEQRAIACVLGALDDKIELNRRMNATLEGLARAVFRSWFVDFDPVVAKASGRRPVGMTADTAALFPNAFADSPLGPIPKGWRVGKIGDLMDQKREIVNPATSSLETFDHYSIPAFDNERRPVREPGAAIKSNKYLIPKNSLLLSKLNPDTPRIWLPRATAEHRQICSTEFVVAVPKASSSVEFLFGLFTSQEFTDEFATLVTGTSNSHQRVKPGDLTNMDALIPSAEAREVYREKVRPLLQRRFQNDQQSATLSSLRDALLPRLLSGELRLKDAGAVANNVV
jgi:type I restriction enzyme, S subunit